MSPDHRLRYLPSGLSLWAGPALVVLIFPLTSDSQAIGAHFIGPCPPSPEGPPALPSLDSQATGGPHSFLTPSSVPRAWGVRAEVGELPSEAWNQHRSPQGPVWPAGLGVRPPAA